MKTKNYFSSNELKHVMEQVLVNEFGDDLHVYVGILYYKIFGESPELYNVYFNEDQKLSYVDGLSHDDKKLANVKTSIDLYETVRKIKDANLDDLFVIVISPASFYLVSCNLEAPFIAYECCSSSPCMGIYTSGPIDNVMDILRKYTVIERTGEAEFGIATFTHSGAITTNYYDYIPTNVNVETNYNDDIPADKIDKLINSDKSEFLILYGEAGTGKSSLIKWLIGKNTQKNFIFFDSSMLQAAQYNSLVSYFLDNEDAVFIFEDCENLIKNRQLTNSPFISIFLNMTDGIIGDVLKCKIICTFNTNIANVDPALLRKGRLSIKYEFKKLSKDKCVELAKEIYKDNENLDNIISSIKGDMTLADVYNIDKNIDFSKKQGKIGF